MSFNKSEKIPSKILFEYIWIDSNGNPRSKIKLINSNNVGIDNIPDSNFDGSSTGQAEGKDSDVLIKPRSIYPNPFVNYI